DPVLPKLSGRITRIDLPGFGSSTPIALHSVADHADHVARVMDALDLPRDSTVFGNGFGAFVALELAIRRGKRFGKFIVADPLDQTTPPALARELARKIPGARYEEIAGSGHCPMLEQPDALVAKLLAAR